MRLGGGGGARGAAVDFVEAAVATAAATGGLGVGATAAFPGSGCDAGFGREAAGFWKDIMSKRTRDRTYLLTADGPPFRRSFPCVIGLTTPSFFVGIGRDWLDGDSPEGTCTVWLL